MIVTVTLNTAIDKTLSVPNFRLGRRHRTVEQTTMPGGKGVNVARVLKTLGAPVIATGLAGGATGTRIVEHLTEESVDEAVGAGADSPSYVSDPKVTDRGIEVYIDNKGVIPDSMAATLRKVLTEELESAGYTGRISAVTGLE